MVMKKAQQTEIHWLQEIGIKLWDVDNGGWNQKQIRGCAWQVTLEELCVYFRFQFPHVQNESGVLDDL